MKKRHLIIALLALLIIVVLGALVDVMEVDPASYAAMSEQWWRSPNKWSFFDGGRPYLDKPPLIFWLPALSYQLLGVGTVQYKLPSLLFALLGAWSTYRFAELFHARRTAIVALLIYGTTASFFLMVNDIRTDSMLTGAVMFALWKGAAYVLRRRWPDLLLFAVGAGLAMLAKGPIGLMVPVLAIGTHLMIKRQLRKVLDPRLFVVPVVIGAMLVPMCIGLYKQYGPEGLRFYFWTQSFGRLTGEATIRDDSDGTFFLHTFLWEMLPWTLFTLAGLWAILRGWLREGAARVPEFISIGGVVLTITALSFSQYKLPHYLFVIIPLASVITAQVLVAAGEGRGIGQFVLSMALGLAMLFLCFISFPVHVPVLGILMAAAIILAIVVFRRSRGWERRFWPTFITMCGIGIALHGQIYPELLKYQANSVAAKWIARNVPPGTRILNTAIGEHAFLFYARRGNVWLDNATEAAARLQPGDLVYTDQQGYRTLLGLGHEPKQVRSFRNTRVQSLDIGFLWPPERERQLGTNYLLQY